jgi:hypothetical protein
MIYPGDVYHLIFSLSHTDGTTPSVTTPPLVSVISLATGMVVTSLSAMTLVAGTNLVYAYPWVTSGLPVGNYLAVVSYAADGNTINHQFLEKLRLGDTCVSGPVALDATVAKDLTVAHDSTVAHLSDLATISPNTSTAVLAIKAKTDSLPTDPVSQATITALASTVGDLHDAVLGTLIVDKTQNPKVLSFYRLNGTLLAKFTVTEDGNSAARTVTT